MSSMSSIELNFLTLIDYYLSLYQYSTAQFYSERLYSISSISDHLYLLAKCYYLQGNIRQVYYLLREEKISLSCRYLFAIVCITLGKLNEAEESLLPFEHLNPKNMINEDIKDIPGGTNGLYLLGVICKKEQRKEFAIAYFKKCLEVIESSFVLHLLNFLD
jgi:hypothetical protein